MKNSNLRIINIIRRNLKRKKNDLKIKILSTWLPLKIIIGSGDIKYPGWIVTDIDNLNILNLKDWKRYFSENSIDAILAEHVWEHLTVGESNKAAGICYLFLKHGGHLRIAVPDGFHPDQAYIDQVKPLGIGPGSEDHKVLYNYQTLSQLFTSTGFKVELLEYWDEKGKFHFVPWEIKDGFIQRSKYHDLRNREGILKYTSLIIDAKKI